jgi:hypothetical protein
MCDHAHQQPERHLSATELEKTQNTLLRTVGKQEPSYIAGEDLSSYNHCGEQFGILTK